MILFRDGTPQSSPTANGKLRITNYKFEITNHKSSNPVLPSGQWQDLPPPVQHVLHLHRVHPDPDDVVAAIDDVALGGDENVVALGQEDLLALARQTGEAEEPEVDGRRSRRPLWLRNHRGHGLRDGALLLSAEDVAPAA